MATVYLARDVKHGRSVALKVLRPELAATIGSARFLHEIEIAAQLQHPNILPLLDSGEADGFLFYAMPFIDGPSLRERLVHQGELPVHDAIRILIEIVDALSAAHARGIVHRDIKPDNVLLTGRHALVTDFGVAKAVGESTGRHALTTAGIALGTPAYMAPEQASAEPSIDHRVDVYAVGAVAYELLTGRPPFTGISSQAILAAHLTEQPAPVTTHRPSVSAALEQVVMRCLAKHPADRWQSAGELLSQLEALATPGEGVTPTHLTTKSARQPSSLWNRNSRIVVTGAAIVALILVGLSLTRRKAPPTIGLGQIRQATLELGLEMQPSLSSDGRLLAYAGSVAGGATHIFVRPVAGGDPVNVTRGLAGNHQWPKWSPDGSQILFATGSGLYIVPQLGGVPRLVIRGAVQGTWSPDGRQIAYIQPVNAATSALFVRDVAGGDPRKAAEGNDLHSPVWSPKADLIAYISGNLGFGANVRALGNLGPSGLNVVSVATGTVVELAPRRFLYMSPAWMPDGRTLLVVSNRDGGRDVHRIRVDRHGRQDGPFVRLTTGLSVASVSISADGTRLAYTKFENTENVFAIPIPRGAAVSVKDAVPVTTGTQHIEGLSVSRDGKWIAFDSDRGGTSDVYKMALPDGVPIQLTTDVHDDFLPAWSPEGSWIAYQSWRNGNRDLRVVSADGTTDVAVTNTPFQERMADWSPDGAHITFYSDSTGPSEIFVADREPDGNWGGTRRLTHGGGSQPKWSPDGTTILYTRGDGVYAVGSDGSNERKLIDNPADSVGIAQLVDLAVWAPDGQSIYLKTIDGFWVAPRSGGTPRLIVRFDDPDRPAGRQEFATDGKLLFFTIPTRQSDIYVTDVKVGK